MITKTTTNLMLFAGAILAAALFTLIPADAFATGVDLEAQSKVLAQQASIVPRLIAVGAYVIGAFFAVKALFALKGFIESPDDNPVTKVLSYAAVSALLILLPYIIDVATNTIGAAKTNQESSAASFTETGNI